MTTKELTGIIKEIEVTYTPKIGKKLPHMAIWAKTNTGHALSIEATKVFDMNRIEAEKQRLKQANRYLVGKKVTYLPILNDHAVEWNEPEKIGFISNYIDDIVKK